MFGAIFDGLTGTGMSSVLLGVSAFGFAAMVVCTAFLIRSMNKPEYSQEKKLVHFTVLSLAFLGIASLIIDMRA